MASRRLTLSRARELRSNTTLPEGVLWRELRGRALAGLKFRRQHPLAPYILDFYYMSKRLAVEVDGWGHNMGDASHDTRRDAWLATHGVEVLRFTAADVLHEMDSVLSTVEAAAARRPPQSGCA